jgi:hypothetical protein
MDYLLMGVLSASALVLAVLVWLMWRSATAPEWSEFSRKEKSEIHGKKE